MNKKILLVSQHYYPDMVSTGLHMTELTTRWKEMYPDVDIDVFVGEDSRDKTKRNLVKLEIYKGVKIYRVKNIGKHHGGLCSRIFFSVGFMVKSFLFLLRKRKHYDILILTTNPPFLGILSLLFKRCLHLPYVIIAYDIYPEILSKMGVLKESHIIFKFWSWLNIKVYNNASKIVSIGEDMSKIIVQKMKVKDVTKIQLIHNWSDKRTVFPVPSSKNEFISEYKLQGKKILLYSGTLGKTHNIEVILDAADDLRNDKDIVFVFIGSGAKASKIENYINNSGNENVIFLPFQPIDKISQTLSAADLAFVCLDSPYTGLSVPSKAYGILAAKVPICGILDFDSEIAQMIYKNKCGVVWNNTSKDKLSILLLNLLNNEKLLESMKDKAYDTFIDNYDISISVHKYHDLMTSI